jgi:opacity protein-like surface antigen
VPAALVGVSSATLAADMPRDPPWAPPPSYESQQHETELSSGLYLRGDLGYRFQQTGESASLNTASVPVPNGPTLDNAAVLGLGVGLQQNWLRLDLTSDYGWRSQYKADVASGGAISGTVESYTVLGNAYADLGTWYGFTPYIGAGLGAAYLKFNNYEYGAAVAPMPSTAVPLQRWNFAWAAMAGVSYKAAHNILIDVGYRHIDLGDISGGPSANLSIKKLTGDEIRIGFRYLID